MTWHSIETALFMDIWAVVCMERGTSTEDEVHPFLEDTCLFLVRISLKWALEHDSVVQRGKCLSVSLPW